MTLLKEFREEFDKYGFILTAAVAATGSTVDTAYDIPNLSKYLDYIHIMAYDFHGSYDGVTGQNAPLYASSVDTTAAQKLLNVVSKTGKFLMILLSSYAFFFVFFSLAS